VAFALIEHKEHTNMKPKNTICLWFDKEAHEAARFYAVTFPELADFQSITGSRPTPRGILP